MEKRVQDYSKEILKIIRSNTSPAVMGERLQDYHENDLADVMPKLTVQERCKLYRILDIDMLSDIFEYTAPVVCGLTGRHREPALQEISSMTMLFLMTSRQGMTLSQA